ncbi:hypothetical protein CRYUN_Cryun26dG0081100 [Craigia yunnanensis]
MFILRVHSVDTEQPPITTTEEIEFYTTTSPSNPNPKFSERRGVVHLYRKASQTLAPVPLRSSSSPSPTTSQPPISSDSLAPTSTIPPSFLSSGIFIALYHAFF